MRSALKRQMTEVLPDVRDRFLGALLGMAIGDALGIAVEGKEPAEIQATFGQVGQFLPLLNDSGAEIEPAGLFSDNTELALCLIESIVTSNGFVNPDTAGYRFLQVLHSPQAHFLGTTTRRALEVAEETGNFQSGQGGDRSAGTSPAARVAPVALAHALSEFNAQLLVREVMRASFITHAHPEAINGALAVAYALRLAVRRELPPDLIIDEVLAFIDEDEVARRLRLARDYSRFRRRPAGDARVLEELGISGYVAETVATALYIFGTRGTDFRDAIQVAANLGGAASARGAIVGALAGAWAGAESLPLDLIDQLEGRMYILMASPTLLKTAQLRAGLFLHLHEI